MKLKIFVIPVATIIAAVLMWMDTAPYREATNDLAAKASSNVRNVARKNLEDDLRRFADCNGLRKENPSTKEFEYAPEARSCLIASMPQTKTTTGAIAFATSAIFWLTRHPDDSDVRAAALSAIANGRNDLASSKSWYYDPLEKVAETHDRSVILKLRNGQQNTSSRFDYMTEELDQLEFSVMLPVVAQRQREWRLKAITGKSS